MLNKTVFRVKFLTSLGKVNDYVTDIYEKCMDVNIKLFIFLNMRDHFTKKAKNGKASQEFNLLYYFIFVYLSFNFYLIFYFVSRGHF